MTIQKLCIGLSFAATVVACGGGGDRGGYTTSPGPTGNPSPAASNTITVSNNSYSPAAKAVAGGTTLQWNWDTCSGGYGNTCVSHSVTFDDGTKSPTQETGSFSRTFTVAGTYNYHCAVHGTSMSGTVTVQ